MAKTMLLMSSTVQAGYSIDLKRDSLIQLNSQRLWPRFSPHLFNPLPSTSFSFSSSSSSRTFTTLALFKSKTKAPPSKVINCFSNYFIILNNLCTLFIFFFWFSILNLIMPRDLYRLWSPSQRQRLKMAFLALLGVLVLPSRTSSLLVVLPCSVLLWVKVSFHSSISSTATWFFISSYFQQIHCFIHTHSCHVWLQSDWLVVIIVVYEHPRTHSHS